MKRMLAFIREGTARDIDAATAQALREAIADVAACTIAGAEAPVSGIVRRYAALQHGAGPCSVAASGERLSPAGAALVNATMANALDNDDGHRLTKGHPGAVVFPAALAAAEHVGASGAAFLDAMLVAYETAIRAGIAAHAQRPDYHCTGSWGAVGAAAGAGRLLGLTEGQLGHALGIAEYQATYSPMMRCIDAPSMLKDGIGWGSMAGIGAAYLAREGFTGIPSLFAFADAEPLLAELGERYRVNELYYKPYPCCRWAQPAIEAMLALERTYGSLRGTIASIVIHTFAESSRLIKTYPRDTEEAQYNLFYPLAAYLAFGELGPRQALHTLEHPAPRAYMDRMEVRVDPALDAQFPAKALSRLELRLTSGEVLVSGAMQARGDYDYPLSFAEKREKFRRLTAPVLGAERSDELYGTIMELDRLDNMGGLIALMQGSAANGGGAA
ncbi:MmgE/PrpD family protein [Paenibacillus cymbidii]|uniref:MmgE/PrpD family protein n=1 Tax=Paenibacillus cymbidii TaxID=1639034 RepID=UPI0010807391|nr:MmgE/PrpD family protein [Paenibacillus cymbidii]